MSKNYEIDNVDLKILNILMEDAKIPYTEVAKEFLYREVLCMFG